MSRPKPSESSLAEDFTFYFGYFAPYRGRILQTAFYFVVKRLPMMMLPVTMVLFLEKYVPSSDVKGIVMLSAAVASFYLFHVVFHMTYTLETQVKMVKNVSRDIRSALVNRLQLLSVGFLDTNHSGRLFSKIMVDVEKLEGFATQFFDLFFSILVSALFASAVLIGADLRLFLLCLTLVPVYALIYWIFSGKIRTQQHRLRLANENLARNVGSFLASQALARNHGEEEAEFKRIEAATERELASIRSLRLTEGFFGSFLSVSGELANIAVVCIGAQAVLSGRLGTATLVLFLQFMSVILEQVRALLGFLPQWTAFHEAVVSVKEVLDNPDLEAGGGRLPLPNLSNMRGQIVFQNVTYGHDGRNPLFRDLTVEIKEGTTVALVGESGSGKTTFVNLVLGLYRPQDGVIKIDGHPLAQTDLRSIRKRAGVVTQDAILFSGTVAENIAHARNKAAMAEVERAAKEAHAHEFILGLPRGYQTLIGEGGVPLSGGQRQRIAIARALFRKPKLLILDEATSALDSETEAEVQKVLDEIRGTRTILIIAHRLSTVYSSDRIMVFKAGRIVEDGTHLELSRRGEEYARLLSLQLGVDLSEVARLAGEGRTDPRHAASGESTAGDRNGVEKGGVP